MRYKGTYLFTIGPEHVGKTSIEVPCQRTDHCAGCRPAVYALGSVMGRVLPIDVGKQVYDVGDGILQVENNEQRDARLGVEHEPRR